MASHDPSTMIAESQATSAMPHRREVDASTTTSMADENDVPGSQDPEKHMHEHQAKVEDEPEYPHGFKLAVILSALCLAVFLVALDQTIISTAIPTITDRFHSIQDIGWYGSSYLLTTTALQPTFGRIYTIFSIKHTFLTAIFIFEIGKLSVGSFRSLVCATAPSSTALIIGRALAGIGVGGLFSGAVVILAYCLPLRKRPAAFGLIGGMWGIASVAGPLLGGVFTLPIGAIAMVVIFLVLKINRENNPDNLSFLKRILQLDLIGMFLIIPTIVCLLLALQWGGTTYLWKSPTIIGLFIGAGVLGIMFIASQLWLGDKGTLPPRFFRDRNMICAMGFAFFFGAGFFAIIYYLAIYFQSIQGSSATHAGIQLLPLLITTVISSIVTGGLITALGHYTPIMIFSMVLFSVGAGLITTFNLTTPFGQWFGYQVLAGAGIGVGFQGAILVCQTVLPLKDVPVGTACISFFQSLGGALFIAVAQTLFQTGLLNGIEKNAPQLDAHLFLHSGATQIREILREVGRPQDLDAVLQAYVDGLTHTYWITTACAIAALVCSCCLQWKSVKGEAPGKEMDNHVTSNMEQKGEVDVAKGDAGVDGKF
ncbi:hypothetical protein BP5796_00194 [Coleophoma crateriformis]|uniref:Major facilitator superfamily (MFS) profile domain-containing protein n=1 Tax=Coleophoma crateriformis TaxID=565419 RepID=A0A3D8T7L5_9HELO|nr:hypothetical protein BP5796_00194 [Coleophoma crateriformis]